MTANHEKKNDKVEGEKSSSRSMGQNPGSGTQKSAIREIIDVIREHPSIVRIAKCLGAYYIFLQFFGIIFGVFIFMKIVSVIDDHQEAQITMAEELEAHIKDFNKKFDDEKEKKRQDLINKIMTNRRRFEGIRGMVSDQQDYVEKSMILMRDAREERHVIFKKDMMGASDEEMKKVYAEKAAWDIERDAKLEKIRLRQEKSKLELKEEEENLLALEKELEEVTASITSPDPDQKIKKKKKKRF